MRSERDARLRAAFAALEPRDRLLLVLRFEDGLSASRIAATLEMATPFHVYRRLHAVLARLRTTLQAVGVDGADG